MQPTEQKTSYPRCPLCGGAMRKKTGTRGEFLSCLRYPDCKGKSELNYTPPSVAEAMTAQTIKLSPRTLAAIHITAGLCHNAETENWDGQDIIDTAMSLTKKLMIALKTDNEERMAIQKREQFEAQRKKEEEGIA